MNLWKFYTNKMLILYALYIMGIFLYDFIWEIKRYVSVQKFWKSLVYTILEMDFGD